MLHFTGASSVSSNLNYVDLTVITNSQCANTYGNIITSTKICTSTTGGRSTCNVSFSFRYSSEINFLLSTTKKLAATIQTSTMVTNFHCSMSVVQSVLLSIVRIQIGPESVYSMKHFSFKSIFLKFPSLKVTLLTSTSRVTFQYICLALQGDSGGPLVYLECDGVYTQVGIVSFGAAAGCELGYPAAFTRVTSYLNWISSKTGLTFD